MRFRRFRSLSCLGVLVLAAGSAQAFTPHASTHDLEFPLAWDTVPPVFESQRIETTTFGRSALGTGWVVQTNRRTGFLHMAYGGNVFAANGIAGESEATVAARDFLLANADLLGVRSDNMELRIAKHARGKWVAHFTQVVNRIPVYRGNAFVLMDEAGRVAAFGSDFLPETNDVPAQPAISQTDAIATAAGALGTVPLADRPATTELLWVPAPQGEVMELTLAYRVVFESDEPFGQWESFVDAANGNILARRNLFFPVNVIGTVEGDVQNQPPTYGWCDGSAIEPMPNLTVNVSGGNSDVTDASGDYDISHGGTANVTVTAQLLGPYSNINRYTGLGSDASFSDTATPGTPFTITWDGSNSRQDERTTFFQANKVHDLMKAIDPTFVELDYAMPSVIGRTDGYCPGNAWWDGYGMNYCEGNSTYGNTGELGNVIYHEFGHGVTQEVYLRNGASEPPGDLHEGNSDVIANFLDRNSIIGLGFYMSTCTSGIRDADNNLRYPEDLTGSGHTDGQIIAGFYWDSWQSLLGAKPQAEADDAAFSAWHFARDLGLPTSQPDQVLWTFIADDDDGVLENGTPNHEHFCVGAQNHGFDCPDAYAVFVDHERLPHTTDGSSGFDVQADVTAFEGTLDPSSVKLHYRVDGGSFVEVSMPSIGGSLFEGSIPALLLGEVEYFIEAKNTDDSTGTSPAGAPTNLHGFDVATVYDGLESGAGSWAVTGDATTGHWEVIDPIGTAAQPEDDATPAPGTLAFITGQCGAGGGSCGTGCTLGCNDVDGGTTILTSPVWDLSTATEAKVKYDRWYSNDTGSTTNDTWVVEASNNGGVSWTTVESTTTSQAAWVTREVDIDALFGTPGMVQFRFLASDLGSGSIVEAGVDEIRILAGSPPTDAPELAGSAPIAFGLEQNQPNPFRPETKISYSIPTRSEVNLTVYNIAGQAVRRLATGVKEPGNYGVQWDGRDLTGQRVAAGVYFYRLVAGEQTITKKMTVMQ